MLPNRLFWLPLLIAFVILAGALVVHAQEENTPTVLDISYDETVQDTLTANAFYDWWTIEAGQGDDLVIDMAASGGLEPLIGILNASGDLVTKSDNGGPDSTITLEYITPTAGHYTIVATRVGNANGTSTGSYSLRLRRANSPVVSVDPYQDVTFPCKAQNFEATTAATVAFADDPQPGLAYRVTVYGLDGFQPVIRLNFDSNNAEPYEICNTDAQNTVGDSFTLPGDTTPHTITADTVSSVSQLGATGAEQMGLVTFTIGSKDGASGHYMAVIEGLSIEPKDDTDQVEIRVGPLAAKTTAINVYMVAAPNSRLDPFMTRADTGQECDDAGRGDCADVPSFAHIALTLHDGDGNPYSFTGDRSDAGMRLFPGNPDSLLLTLSSRSGDTHGGYVLILVGELPPRS